MSDKESDGYFDGYEAGLESAEIATVNKYNDRLMYWLLLGLFIGQLLGFYLHLGITTFAATVGLLFLVEKVSKIPHKSI